MKRVIIKSELCQNCAECGVERACGFSAIIREEAGDKPWVDFFKCRGCAKCIQSCPHGAVFEDFSPYM